MKKVDASSYRLDHNLGKDNNKERMILKLEIFWAQIIKGGKFQKKIEKAEECNEFTLFHDGPVTQCREEDMR